MAQKAVPNVHLETMEETEDAIQEPDEAGRTRIPCQADGRNEKSVLGGI